MDQWDALEFALKVVDGHLPGGMWCPECQILTNHRGHPEDEVKPDEEPLDDPDYQDDGGGC